MVDMDVSLLWQSVALLYQISQQYFSTESLPSEPTQCRTPYVSQLPIIKYHLRTNKTIYDTLLRCQLNCFNGISLALASNH